MKIFIIVVALIVLALVIWTVIATIDNQTTSSNQVEKVNEVMEKNLNSSPDTSSKNKNTNITISSNCQTAIQTGYYLYKNEDINICFSYPSSLDEPQAKTGINEDINSPIGDWRSIIIPVNHFSLSFIRTPDYFGRYERAYNNTFYSKPIDTNLDVSEIETILKEDFRNIFEVKKVESKNTTFIEFFELGTYGNNGSLLYEAIIPNKDWGDVVAVYYIDDESFNNYVWDVEHLDDIPETVIDTVKADITSIISGEETEILDNINTLRNIAGSVSPLYTEN